MSRYTVAIPSVNATLIIDFLFIKCNSVSAQPQMDGFA